MGCDIHLYVEKKIDCDGDDLWETADKWVLDEDDEDGVEYKAIHSVPYENSKAM